MAIVTYRVDLASKVHRQGAPAPPPRFGWWSIPLPPFLRFDGVDHPFWQSFVPRASV